MSKFPNPCFRLFTALESLPCSGMKYFVQGHIESLGHNREIIAGARPPFHLLVTLLHHPSHNPATKKYLPCNCTDQTHQGKDWLSLEKGRGSSKIFLVPAHLTPLSFSHPIPFLPHLTVIPFYFGQIFHHPLTSLSARKSISVTPTDSEALQLPELLSCTQPKVSQCPGAECPQGSVPHLAARLFLHSTETPQSKAATEAGATWPRAVPHVTKGILPRLSLRGLENHLLAQNNSHICCSSASCSYLLSQSSFLLCPDNFSCYRFLPCNADTCEELWVGYRWRVSTRSGAFRAHPSHNTEKHHTEQINKQIGFSEAGYSQQAGCH